MPVANKANKMGKDKLRKFEELGKLPNVFQNFKWDVPEVKNCRDELMDFKGNWSREVFGNDKPLVLELACGHGDYSCGLGKLDPDKNFLGIDIKGNRIWTGAKRAIVEGLDNVAFLRTRIQLIDQIFAEEEVAEIWITFPDPFLRKSRAGNRLTSERFLPIYKKVLKEGGRIRLKTDSGPLYDFTHEMMEQFACKVIQDYPDLYATNPEDPVYHIKTKYERMHLEKGKAIKYLEFVF